MVSTIQENFINAVKNNDLQKLEELIQDPAIDSNFIGAKDSEGKNLVMYAASSSKKALELVCSKLSNQDDEILNAKDNNGKTALIYAVENSYEAAEYIQNIVDKVYMVDNYTHQNTYVNELEENSEFFKLPDTTTWLNDPNLGLTSVKGIESNQSLESIGIIGASTYFNYDSEGTLRYVEIIQE